MSVLCDRVDVKDILMKTRVDTDLHHFLRGFLKVLCNPKVGISETPILHFCTGPIDGRTNK
jgi:hypothetical protein